MKHASIVARAFELAASGRFRRVKDVETALQSEAYEPEDLRHLAFPQIQANLALTCLLAQNLGSI
ncbi:MAG: hypothetical protein DCF30_21910 [Hyphomicrobiales bacterium]|nr:MAG: hypothetical protein DCF30_21910 [Hyphomicrobiales bacterium]